MQIREVSPEKVSSETRLTSAPKVLSHPGVSLRAVLIGLLLIPFHVYWITVFEVRWYSLDSTSLPLMITPVFLLFCVVLANLLFRRFSPKKALLQGELLTIYIMLVISGVFASHDMLQNLFGAIGHPVRIASTRPESRWPELFFRYIPWHLFIRDESALKAFYEGNSSYLLYWRAWVGPLFWWTLFVIAVVLVFLCVNLLLRRPWTQYEKLAFPLVQLPLALTSQEGGLNLLSQKMMWLGFLLAFAVGAVNGLGMLFPSIPYFPYVKQYNIGQYFTQRPWNAMGYTPISMYPFAIGLAYFMPLDLSFSCWFFFVFRKLQQVFGSAFGLDTGINRGFPFFGEQASGAWLTLALVVLWGLRGFLRNAWQIAWGIKPAEDPEEALRYRRAFIGIGLGTTFIVIFWLYAGLALWALVVFFTLYFLLSITITRIRAELGTPHEIYFVNPQQIMVNLFGSAALGPTNLTLISCMYWMHRGYRSHPMPNQLEAFKMAEGGRISLKRLLPLIFLTSIFSILVTYWANLSVTYEAGASARCIGFKSWVGAESFNRLETWLSNIQRRESIRLFYMAFGSLFVIFLSFMRSLFLWWPFHPAGYALAVSYAMDYFWFCVFIAWAVKALLIRYGGMKVHNQFVPFFLGLVLGDYTVGSLWALIGPALKIVTYKIYI